MVLNRQTRVPVAAAELERFLARVIRLLHLPRSAATVCFVSDAGIAKWNRAYRGKSKPTDVLSFPTATVALRNKEAGSNPARPRSGSQLSWHSESSRFWRGEESAAKILIGRNTAKKAGKGTRRGNSRVDKTNRRYLGDIAIAPAVARKNALRLGRSLGDELRVLILHGVLHLMGYDHESDSGQMERLELRLRRRLGIG